MSAKKSTDVHTSIRLPKEVVGKIDAAAKQDNRTRSNWIINQLLKAVDKGENQ